MSSHLHRATTHARRHRAALLLSATLVACLLTPAAPRALAVTNGLLSFSDTRGHWAMGSIDTLLQVGILTMPADGKFQPDDNVTRLDFAVWVARAMELSPETPAPGAAPLFTDWDAIPEADRPWIASAVKAGLISGYPDPARGPDAKAFKPSRTITRAELATVFGRSLVALGVKVEDRYRYVFEDRDDIPAWAGPAMASVQAEVIMGRPGLQLARFAPLKLSTRAEAATMINRFLNARAALLPQMAEKPKPVAKPKTVVSAYYINTDGAYRDLQQNGGRLNMLFYFSNPIDKEGNLTGFPSPRTHQAAQQHNLPVLLVVKNFEKAEIAALLRSEKARARAVDNILQRLTDQGFVGVNLDFENVGTDDRDNYTTFVSQVAAALRPKGYLTTIAVPARDARMVAASWGRSYDYAALGAAADYMVVMTYDQHYRASAPGVVGGADWADAVMAYAVSQVSPEKVLLGIPSYGYDWPAGNGANGNGTNGNGAPAEGNQNGKGGGKARPIMDWEAKDDYFSMQELLDKFGGQPEPDTVTGESAYRYVDESGAGHIAYYTDNAGLRTKLGLVAKHKLGGVAMWRLGFEPQEFWDAFAAMAAGRLP